MVPQPTRQMSTSKLLFVHPAIRTYREPLFKRLGEEGFHFLFSKVNDPATFAGQETARLLSEFAYPYVQAREIQWLPISNLSLELLEALKYDLVILTGIASTPTLLLAELLKRLHKRIVLFDETWLYSHQVRRYRVVLPKVRRMLSNCIDSVVVAGTKARDMFTTEFDFPADRIQIAYNTTIDLASAPRAGGTGKVIDNRIATLAQGRRVILYLGRIVEYKGLDVLIRALVGLPSSSCLVVVGGGPFEAECRQLASSLNLDGRIHFVGECNSEDAVHYYSNADIFVLPTRLLLSEPVNCESWGFTINEAMSLGVPVVATTAVGAAFDLIRDGDTGMLATENDQMDLSRKILQLLDDDDLRATVGRRGRSWVKQRCSYDQNAEAFLAAVRIAQQAP